MEGIKNLVSEQQEKILKLEQDLAKSESELNQRERRISDILQTEVCAPHDLQHWLKILLCAFPNHHTILSWFYMQASLRSELEKQKKLSVQWKVVKLYENHLAKTD